MKFSNRGAYLRYIDKLIRIEFKSRRKMCLKHNLSESLVAKFINGRRPARTTERKILKILDIKIVRDGFEVVDRKVPPE